MKIKRLPLYTIILLAWSALTASCFTAPFVCPSASILVKADTPLPYFNRNQNDGPAPDKLFTFEATNKKPVSFYFNENGKKCGFYIDMAIISGSAKQAMQMANEYPLRAFFNNSDPHYLDPPKYSNNGFWGKSCTYYLRKTPEDNAILLISAITLDADKKN